VWRFYQIKKKFIQSWQKEKKKKKKEARIQRDKDICLFVLFSSRDACCFVVCMLVNKKAIEYIGLIGVSNVSMSPLM